MSFRLITAIGLFAFASLARAAFDGGSQAQAATTVDTVVKVVYRIHQTPTDPQTPLVFTVAMWLEKQSSVGNQVAWHAVQIEFRKKGTGGAPDKVWDAYDVPADTTDDLWWVTHANTNTPLASEFKLPPRYFGTAEPVAQTSEDLDFDFRGRTYTPPQGGAPYAVTAGMNYDFDTAVGPQIPPETDEPVECPPINDPNGTA